MNTLFDPIVVSEWVQISYIPYYIQLKSSSWTDYMVLKTFFFHKLNSGPVHGVRLHTFSSYPPIALRELWYDTSAANVSLLPTCWLLLENLLLVDSVVNDMTAQAADLLQYGSSLPGRPNGFMAEQNTRQRRIAENLKSALLSFPYLLVNRKEGLGLFWSSLLARHDFHLN